MKGKTMNYSKALSACVLLGSISACGDSDLEEFQAAEFSDAVAGLDLSDLGEAQPVLFDLSEYRLMFEDNFNGASIDDAKWATTLWQPGTVLLDQQQHYVDAQNNDENFASPFSFDDGVLTINATRTPEGEQSAAFEQPWLSGMLTTREDFNFTYGYVEARISVEEGVGLWPSVWMLGSEFDGLQPQIYIMEHDGSKPDVVAHNYIFTDSQGDVRSPGQQSVAVSGFTSGFNTVGLSWNADELMFFVNGQPTYRVIGDSVPSEDMYLILNLAMGGIWVGDTDQSTPDPAELKIDYVRVYQLR